MDFFDADGLAGEDCAEVNLFIPQTDASAVSDNDDLVMEGIVDVGQSAIRTSRRLIDLSRAFHIEGFVRTLAVEDLEEAIEAGLLLQKVGSRRLGGLVASFFKVRCMCS